MHTQTNTHGLTYWRGPSRAEIKIIWQFSVSLQYCLLYFSLQCCVKSFFSSVKVSCCLSRLQENNNLWTAFFFTRERKKWKLAKLNVPLLVIGLMIFLFYYINCEWERKRDGWMERERVLMEAEICCCRSSLNSWLWWQMWSRYLIVLLWRKNGIKPTLSHSNSYIFYEWLIRNEFVRPHSCDLVQFVQTPVTGRFRGGVRCRSLVQIHTNWQLVKYVRFCKNHINLY